MFDYIDELHYKCHKISLGRCGWYIDSPKPKKKQKKAIINPNNNEGKYFQYAITTALNHEQIKTNPQWTTKTELFIKQHAWNEIDFPLDAKDWKKFETNNKSITLNTLFAPHNEEEIKQAYILKHNPQRPNQVILLIITAGKEWHYLSVKSLSR